MKFTTMLLFLVFAAHAQHAEVIDVAQGTNSRFIGIDKFGYSYFVANNTLTKTNGSISVEYQNLRLGQIGTVDLNNPLKIVVLYPDFNSVVMLDNQLNQISTIDFSKLSEPIVVAAAGNASQNRLWFFDSLSQQIGLYSYDTSTYRFLTQPLVGGTGHWETDFNTFSWIGSDHKRYSVDIYGKVVELGQMPKFDAIKFVSESEVIYVDDGKVYLLNSNGESRKLLEIDPKSFQSFWYKDQILTIFTPDAITNYKIKTP